MKLAEALVQRADLNRRIAQLQDRLCTNARVQEGEAPAEDPNALLAEMDALFAQLEDLITRINLTNAHTQPDGTTLTEMLSKRDCLTAKTAAMRAFLNEASSTTSRALRSEIKILSTVPVAELRKTADALAKELRELDLRIQGLNWVTELL